VSDYTGGGWTEASKATYLISPRIKSPMGAGLAAFSTSEAAAKARGEHGGEVYDWPKLKEKLSSESR
jgi:copper chaperone NosL